MIHNTVLTFGLPLLTAMTGLGFGLVYFAALRRTAELFGSGGGWLGAAGLTLARITGAVALFAAAAWLGAVPLLAAFVGFLSARAIMLRSARRMV